MRIPRGGRSTRLRGQGQERRIRFRDAVPVRRDRRGPAPPAPAISPRRDVRTEGRSDSATATAVRPPRAAGRDHPRAAGQGRGHRIPRPNATAFRHPPQRHHHEALRPVVPRIPRPRAAHPRSRPSPAAGSGCGSPPPTARSQPRWWPKSSLSPQVLSDSREADCSISSLSPISRSIRGDVTGSAGSGLMTSW
jgi:hypothetical protein